MIKQEEIKEKTSQEIAEIYTKDVETYKEYLESKKFEELIDEEKMVLDEMNVYNEYIKGVKYNIPKSVQWDGMGFTRGEIANKIIYFLNKSEVQWSYTLGMYELVKFWKNTANTTMNYGELDSTLRLLEQCKFKGYDEWRDILTINEFFKPTHEDYSKDISRQIYLSKLHNEVLNRKELIATPEDLKKEEMLTV